MISSIGRALRSVPVALLLGTMIAATHWTGAMAQQAPEASPAPAPSPADMAEAAVMTEDELDALVAPIALYPDALLAQIFVASTYPLDVVKAARWTEDNKDMAQGARAAAAEAEGWDPSIAVLAAGFPQVIGKMAAELDQTELLGDALLAQSDDVLAAVQRQRARADAMGNLPSNDAQTVTVEGDNITIAPANPEVVYVPTYDSEGVYTQSAAAPPMIIEPTSSEFSSGTVYVEDDDDDTAALITTGLLSFGAGMLVNEIFDDNDNWGGYWGPGYGGAVGWGGGYVRPYPPGGGYGGGIGNGIGNDINIDVDRSRTRVDGDGNWNPREDRRSDEARNKIADRRGAGEGTRRPSGEDARRNDLRRQLDAKGGGAQAREQLLGGGSGAALAAGAGVGAGLAAQRRPAGSQTAISDRKGGMTGANRSAERGRQSAQRAGAPRQDRARKGGGRQEVARGGGRQQQIQRGGNRPQAQRGGGGGRSAFNQRGGGRNAGAAGSRGGKSRGGGGRGGGGGRRG